MKRSPPCPDTAARLLALGCCALAAIFIARQWGSFGDIQIDFGRELYIPWQLAQGRVLYRDVASFNGPLSPYCNALVFALFSPTRTTLLATNLAVLAATLLFLWKTVRALAGPWAALAALAYFLATTGCNMVTPLANYSSVAPYSHEITHAMLLLYAGIWVLLLFARAPSKGLGATLGLLVGGCLLTKPECALAGLIGLGGGMAAALAASGLPRRQKAVLAAFGIAGAALPMALAVAALSTAMPAGEALANVTRMWRMLAMPEITHLPFFKVVTGLGDIRGNLAQAGWSLVLQAVLAGYLACLALTRTAFDRLPGLVAAVLPVFLLALTYFLLPFPVQSRAILLLPRCWPLLLPLAALVLAIRLPRLPAASRPAGVAGLGLCLVAGALAGKIVLRAVPYHYGALLLGPAGTLWCLWLVGFFPRLFRDASRRRVCAACAVAVCILLPWPLVAHGIARLAAPTATVSSPRGTLTTDFRGPAIAQTLASLRQEARPGDTLAVLPEGAMLNFLSGLPNPTPYIALIPGEWYSFGPRRIEEAYRTHPPTWVIFLDRSMAEYGFPTLCAGYGAALCRFFAAHYTEAAQFGPIADREPGAAVVRLLRRKPAPADKAD
ncbi:hypothetical protein [Solidesulfovibrio sp. C21]|uniref:hypothetical protein n=1 Tax=Solidesulfovibrio sp. C21 TaxID=3398613 RepID=UPI0039FD4BA8